jgi:hypothetical protein
MRLATLAAVIGLAALACGGDDDDRNPAGVGNRCQKNEDCATKLCYLGPGGGYCTAACNNEGDTSACPADTICKPIQGGPRRCLLICGSASTCPEGQCPREFCPMGSSCVSVANTMTKACEPDPERK